MSDAQENQPAGYVPAKIWTQKNAYGGAFGSSNRPVSGATFEQALPVGKHPLQLYSQGTPNGQKVTIMLEELLAAGHSGAEYDAWLIDVFKGDQFGSGFTTVNPNSKTRRSSIARAARASMSLRAVRSSSISRRNSAHFCRANIAPEPRRSIG